MPQAYSGVTALIVVDVQNDFADPAGGLYVEGGEQAVGAANAEIAAAAAAGSAIFYTQDWHPATTPHFAKDGGVWPVHCIADTWGSELHPELDVRPEPAAGPAGNVVRKGTDGSDGYSGFHVRDPESGATSGTGLADLLRAAGTEALVVLGLAGDVCVKATALDGRRLGWPVTVPWSATRCVEQSPDDAAAARRELVEAGVAVVD